MAKKGVLVMAYGSPDKTEDIEAYYTDIRRGNRPTPEQLADLTGRYNAIGGSPLLRITMEQSNGIQNALGAEYQVYIGMRHWKPWILEAVEKMKEDNITEAIGLVMAPHYSSLSIEKYIDKVNEAKNAVYPELDIQFIKEWYAEPLFIEALKQKIAAAMPLFTEKEKEDLTVVFTAHSLPEKILENNDPYPAQLLTTSDMVASTAGIAKWTFAFQSAGRTHEKWLGPDLLQTMEELHADGTKSVLVCSVGFITDHLEVLYDIDIEAKAKAKQLGMHLERTESLNADPLLAQCLASLILKKFDAQ